MRSFKSKVASAFAWGLGLSPALAAVLPTRSLELPRPDGKLLHYDLQHDYAQATFSIPCIGCLGAAHDTDQAGDDDALVLKFTSHAQDEACGSSNITLNGIHLPQEWNGDFASGSGSYTGVTDLQQNDSSSQRDLDLEWNSACLHGDEETDEAAQVLTVSIKAIDGKVLETPSGFTVSFKQQTSPPSLLRLEPVPNQASEDTPSWRNPPTHLRVIFLNDTLSVSQEQSTANSLEEEILELQVLEAQLKKLQQAISQKKTSITFRLSNETTSLKEEINNCDGLACIVKAIAHKAHGAWKVAIIRLKPSGSAETMGRPDLDVYAPAHISTSQKSGGSVKVESGDSLKVDSESESVNPQPYEGYSNELPPRPAKTSPYIIALEVTLSLLCCGCIVAVIRHRCSSLRTRTERAAAREERNTAKAYRRAARRHAWRNWWRGNWRKDQERIEDYEEKRALIQDQESVLEDAMQQEIRQLRAAHEVVNDLVREAEEGRNTVGPLPSCNCQRTSHPYSPSIASTYPPTSLPDIPSRPLSRTDSLPSYRSDPPSEPPNYDSDMDMSGVIANGFRAYTSSQSTTSEATSHWTPDSSVVDVSPRPSAETLRYPRSILTCEEESEDEVD